MDTWRDQIDAGGNLRLIGPTRERVAMAALEFMEMVEAGTAIVPVPDDAPTETPMS